MYGMYVACIYIYMYINIIIIIYHYYHCYYYTYIYVFARERQSRSWNSSRFAVSVLGSLVCHIIPSNMFFFQIVKDHLQVLMDAAG